MKELKICVMHNCWFLNTEVLYLCCKKWYLTPWDEHFSMEKTTAQNKKQKSNNNQGEDLQILPQKRENFPKM